MSPKTGNFKILPCHLYRNVALLAVANYYEEEFDSAVDNMSSLIEPIMIVFMGVMIGGLMIAMYSPIFNVGALIGG